MINQTKIESYNNFITKLQSNNVQILHAITYRNNKISNQTAESLSRLNLNINEDVGKILKFIIDNDKYKYIDYVGNSHHWTTSYCWNIAIRKILTCFNIEFSENHFKKIPFLWNNCDFSYHDPLYGKFTVSVNNKIFKGDTNVLRNINRCPNLLYSWSLYHMLCILSHESGLIQNEICKSGNLVINCDSMAIPLIPLLSNYFRNILVIDKRTTINYNNISKITQFNPTHYLAIFTEDNILNNFKHISNLEL